MWMTYILQCSDKSYYIGVTTNLMRRLKEHNSGRGSKYVRSHRPAKVVWSEGFFNRSNAQIAECRLKKMSRKEKAMLVNRRTKEWAS